MTTRAASKASYHHGDLARALIEAGVRAVEEGGAAALQVKKLAEPLGVTHAAVYRHFRDRAALQRAIAREGFALLQTKMNRARDAAPAASRQQLLDVGFAVIEFALAHPRLSELMFQGHVPTQLSELEGDFAEPEIGFAALVGLVEQWQRTGVLRAGEPRELAMSLWVTTLGLSVLLVSGQLSLPRKRLRALVDAVHLRMLDGLAPARGTSKLR